jgi:hypothetical protein
MQITNFILSVNGGGIAVEMSEREILTLAGRILATRVYKYVPGKFEDYELYEMHGALYADVFNDGQGNTFPHGTETTPQCVTDNAEAVKLFAVLPLINEVAKEYM